MFEMCCTRLGENTGRKKSPFWHHCTTLSGCIFAAKARIDNRKNMLNNDTSSICPHNTVNFGLPTAEICWRVWGTHANFNGFCVLAALLHGTLVLGRAAITLGIGADSSLISFVRGRQQYNMHPYLNPKPNPNLALNFDL